MTSKFKALVVGIAAFVALAATPAAFAARGATVIAAAGDVAVDATGKGFKPIKVGSLVGAGDTVRTGADSSAGLLFTDGTQVRLREHTTLTIEAFDVQRGRRTSLLSLARGFARMVVEKLKRGERFEVKTPNSVAAVKGTDLGSGYDPDKGSTLL